MPKEVLKVEDLKVGVILTQNTNYNMTLNDIRVFLRIEEIASEMVYLEKLKNKYIQNSSQKAYIMPTNEVEIFYKSCQEDVLSNYKLYNKYDVYEERRWDIHVGDALGSGDCNIFYEKKNKLYESYFRVKKVYDYEVIVDEMRSNIPTVSNSRLLNKSYLINHCYRICG